MTGHQVPAVSLDELDDGLDALRVGLMLTDANDVVRYANAHMRLNFPELDGPDGSGVIGVTVARAYDRLANRLAVSPEQVSNERVKGRQGDARSAYDVPLRDGRILSVKERRHPRGGQILLWTDVTDARRQSARLEDAIITSSEGFAFFDAKGQMDLWNDGFAIAFGGASGVIRGQRIADILSNASRDERIVIVGEPPTFDALNETPHARDFLLAHADGRRLRLRVRPTRAPGQVAVLTDVTADAAQADTIARRGAALAEATTALRESRSRMRLQTASLLGLKEELHRARRDANDAERAKQAFMRTITHELRTPLNAIIGFSEIIEQEVCGPLGSPQYVEYAGLVTDAGRRLLRVINRIVDITRLETGLAALTADQRDVAPILERIVGEHADAARQKGVNLRLDIADDVPQVWADEDALRTILANLVENALEHTPSGGVVTMAAQHHDGYVALIVSDTGVGIAPADLERVLLPFEQAGSSERREGSMSDSGDGAGLGLAVVKALAEAMEGAFELGSTVGIGTRAVVTLRGASDEAGHAEGIAGAA